MQKIIPVYYSEYGRYINRFRAIPSFIDGLKPVERRLLLTLHEVAKNNKVKSAKIVGTCLGSYHPHGDTSLYGTLVNLVDQGYATGQGNWGSQGVLKDDPPAHYRYTEVKLEKWVEDLAFEYINYVQWEEFELDPEPVYLPCPVPIGLIGRDVTTGISFYRTVIPKFKISDLAKRLVYLLEKKGSRVEVFPNAKNCDIYEILPDQMNSILTKGTGSLSYVPHGKLDPKVIRIQGRVPTSSFDSLCSDVDKLDINIIDKSKKILDGIVEPRKRGTDLQALGTFLWDKYLTKNINFNCLFCDNEGKVKVYGIDEILSNNYICWQYSVKLKRVDDFNKLSNGKVEMMVVQIIRYIFEQYKSIKVEDIVNKYHELKKTMDVSIEIDVFNIDTNKWSKEIKNITDQDIVDVCNKRSIKNLIETIIDTQKAEQKLISARSLIDTSEKNCFDFVAQLR